jgi:hypothetical protein
MLDFGGFYGWNQLNLLSRYWIRMMNISMSESGTTWKSYVAVHEAGMHLLIQSIDATHALNRSAGVSKSNVFLGRPLSCRATALSLA